MKSLTIKDNFEIRSNIGNGYFKMAPLVRTADKQLFYPIVKFQPNICITGLELAITEDKQKLLIQNYLCCIDNTISQLEKLNALVHLFVGVHFAAP